MEEDGLVAHVKSAADRIYLSSGGFPRPKAAVFRVNAVNRVKVQDTLALGEVARASAMAQFGRLCNGMLSNTLSGRSTERRLIGHQHAFYLPVDQDNDGNIDLLVVFALAGFSDRECVALSNLESLTWIDSHAASELQNGNGTRGTRVEVGLELESFVTSTALNDYASVFGPAKRWRSRTPFVLSRYPKQYRSGKPKLNKDGHQIDGPEDQLLQEWDRRRAEVPTLPKISRIERFKYLVMADGRALSWRGFRRRRRRGGGQSSGFVFGFEIEFEAAVERYPIALGYGCHFGLGQFAPIE